MMAVLFIGRARSLTSQERWNVFDPSPNVWPHFHVSESKDLLPKRSNIGMISHVSEPPQVIHVNGTGTLSFAFAIRL